MTPSIRSRLLFRVISGMAVLLAVLSFVVYGVMYRSLMSDFDDVMVSTARTIATSVEQSDEKIKIEVDEREMPEFRRNDRPDYFQLWRDDGTVLVRSVSLRGADLGIFGGSSAPEFRTITLPDGRAGRAIGLVIVPRSDEETGSVSRPRSVTLVLARGTAALDSEIRFLRWLFIAATGGSIGLAFLIGTVIVRQGLAPLEELASCIAAIRQDELSTKIPSDGMPVEIVPVAQRLNDLLVRLEEAFRRERTFTADAAHELRTPLAGIRSILEVSLSRPRAGKEYQQAMEECLDIVRHTQVLTDGLLSLARLDAGQTQIHLERVVLADVIASQWQPFADSARARGISVELSGSTDAHCMADRETLHMILGNIFANAVEYTDDGGSIEITSAPAGDTMELTVTNTGCPLSQEEARDVFERFWRGDTSRTKTGTHCGLGLSLVQRAVTSLEGTADASVSDGRFSIRIRIPMASQC
jgi:signal transduction histidine kinase